MLLFNNLLACCILNLRINFSQDIDFILTLYSICCVIFAKNFSLQQSLEDNKIFIRPENIISTNQGLFINLNGTEFYQLPLLQFNKNGHFIEGRVIKDLDLQATKKALSKRPCPNCGVNTDKSGRCTNNNCLLCGFKVL